MLKTSVAVGTVSAAAFLGAASLVSGSESAHVDCAEAEATRSAGFGISGELLVGSDRGAVDCPIVQPDQVADNDAQIPLDGHVSYDDAFTLAVAESRIQSFLRDWRSCMSERGWKVSDPGELIESLEDRLLAILDETTSALRADDADEKAIGEKQRQDLGSLHARELSAFAAHEACQGPEGVAMLHAVMTEIASE